MFLFEWLGKTVTGKIKVNKNTKDDILTTLSWNMTFPEKQSASIALLLLIMGLVAVTLITYIVFMFLNIF